MMAAAARMAFASCGRLQALSVPALPRTRRTVAKPIHFLAARSASVLCYCSSSSSSDAATAAPQAVGEEEEEKKLAASEVPVEELAALLDIRVGRVVKAWRHPEADTLFVEEVDVGEEQPRTICSGLVNYLPLEQLQDSNVIVLANLKPRNMRGIKSNGMLMAASDASHENVELLTPPEGSVPGERIWFGAEDDKDRQSEAASPNQVQKKKIWESVQPHLRTSENCTAFLGEHPMRTSAGVVFCRTLQGARVS
ncbi:aminoacyl tRNA synthase complex-interacting multifunctional protein 1 [Oryza brachyantha]|uniref:tRNA-binding domain-containing protein n=1 Tax=Oryza brachyantha TaxID=4533 RepID=J3LWL7_ORYBR|nr:aminoacyl tRNA synthase complex-interacting multifunctional protein 1 [Oryza brachyantha]